MGLGVFEGSIEGNERQRKYSWTAEWSCLGKNRAEGRTSPRIQRREVGGPSLFVESVLFIGDNMRSSWGVFYGAPPGRLY